MNATELYWATLGLAHVAVIKADLTWHLTDRLGRMRSVFGGAVRAYLPGFTDDADPYAHRLELADRIESQEGALRCIRWMRTLAANHSIKRFVLNQDVLAFTTVRNAQSKLEQERLEHRGATTDVKLQLALRRIADLEQQSVELQEQLDFFDAEHKRAESRAEVAEQQLRAARFRINELLARLRQQGGFTEYEDEMPKAWSSVADWCDRSFAGQLVLAKPARYGAREPEFKDVGIVARCLKWLATDYREKRVKRGEGSLRDVQVLNGIRNSPCGGDTYEIFWEGRNYTVDWHLKNGGNTRDPSRCLRIIIFGTTNPAKL